VSESVKEINVGLLAYGAIGDEHSRAISAVDGLRLTAVADTNPDRLSAAKDLAPDITTFTDSIQMLDSGLIDLVVISTPPNSHYLWAKESLNRGLNVILEKPMALSVEHCDELMALAASKNLLLVVYQNRRFDADFITIKKLIDDGKLTHLEIHSIDRIHRTTIGAIQLWKYFTDRNITLVCRNPNIRNFDADGYPDYFSETLMSLLAVMSGYEKSLIKERQMEGIRLRQAKGLYMGRRINTKSTPEHHLKKERSIKILDYLKKGTYTAREVAAILNTSTTTITKTKKIAKELGVL
jgi:hypothetical protein